jgi:hypothetical protein
LFVGADNDVGSAWSAGGATSGTTSGGVGSDTFFLGCTIVGVIAGVGASIDEGAEGTGGAGSVFFDLTLKVTVFH